MDLRTLPRRRADEGAEKIERSEAAGYSKREGGQKRMPIFEYQCRDCGAKFEKIVASSAARVTCKNCESPEVRMLLSVFAVGGERKSSAPEPGPCGACGAPRRGMCGE